MDDKTKKIIVYLGIGCFIALVILMLVETHSYYFATAGSARTNDLALVDDTHLPSGNDTHLPSGNNTNSNTKEGFNVLDVKDEVKQFPDILDYIEKVEEPQFYQTSTAIGCYDNNDIISRIHPDETCKSWYPKVTDIFFKPKSKNDVPRTTNDTNYNNYFNVGGETYSFSELCPETTNQKNPIVCLHERANAFDIMSHKITNINDIIQNKQDQKINNLESNVSYHIIDANRTYNKSNVRDFIGYERSLGLGKQLYNGGPDDQLNDIGLYTQKQRVNYLGNMSQK